MSLFVGAALLAGAVVLFLLHPMITGESAPMEGEEDEMTEAESRRRVKLRALRDVEYDHATGKLDDDDYESLKRELSAEALAALEAEKAERADRDPASLEDEIARVREGLRSGLTCARCGHLNAADSRFCAHCGTRLAVGGDSASEPGASARTGAGAGER
ncbi:MAG: c-type cytochrome biogenesis protein CcmI [Gemmatimonadetes bacterium]|nr:c-type cytochrome biogenesis protein CcmI [Gemmatimonadota bacterium]